MSVIYLAVATQPEGCGLAVFKKDAGGSIEPGSIKMQLGEGELLRTGYLPRLDSNWKHPGRCLRQAVAVRRWFNTGPSVGGACVPEVFIYSKDVRREVPMFLGALAMAWCASRDDEDLLNCEEDPSWFYSIPGPVTEGLGGTRSKVKVLNHLSKREREMVMEDPMSSIIEAVCVGLIHLKRMG